LGFGRRIVSTPLSHPVLGPAVAIYADLGKARLNAFVDLWFMAPAALGLWLGLHDMQSGPTDFFGVVIPGLVLGLAQIGAAFIVGGWGIRGTIMNVQLYRRKVMLVVGRDGFEASLGHGPVGWDEVASVVDPSARGGPALNVRVQLADASDYAAKHSLSALDRIELLLAKNTLTVGPPNLIATELVEDLMLMRFKEFKNPSSAATTAPSGRARTRPLRRPIKK
jgi:hypothetical protein